MVEGGHLFCLDWTLHSLELFGSWRTGNNFAFVDIMLMPCGSSKENAAVDCIWEKEKIKSYLSENWELVVYHNEPEFKHDSYNDERIETKSVLTKIRTVYEGDMTAGFTDFFVKKNALSDETGLIQLGYDDEIEFYSIEHEEQPYDSRDNIWPTRENRSLYKLNSVLLNLSQRQTVIER